MTALNSLFLSIIIGTFKSIIIFSILLIITSCQKEDMEEVKPSTPSTTTEIVTPATKDSTVTEITTMDTVKTDNPLIGIYIGESVIIDSRSESIHDTMTGDFIKYIDISDTTFSKMDTVFILQDTVSNQFKILGRGAISQINEFVNFSFKYDGQSEFEISDGFEGYRTQSVRLIFDEVGAITVDYSDWTIYGDRPEDVYHIKFSGVKQE